MFDSIHKTLRRHNAEETGFTMVEFAITATVFFLLFFAVIDFGFLFCAKVTLQNAVRQAGRYAITGDCSSGTCFGTNGNRLPTIFNTVSNYSMFFTPTVTVACIAGGCAGTYGGSTGNAGGPGDTVQITATYTWYPFVITRFVPTMFPGGSYTFSTSATFVNEPFAPPSS
jgi:Flp pilus assembly protein TadG